MQPVRLLIDPPLTGPENMARDETLLQNCQNHDTPPVVRFYSWRPPTISLGYFQEYAEYEQLPPPAGELAVVRRPTGGGAILHDREVTYSLTMPLGHPLIVGRPNDLYRLTHAAIIRAVGERVRMLGKGHASCDSSAQRGPFFCFERRHDLDVVLDNRNGPGGVSKLAGSAQRRTKTAILQHGSIMLDSRYTQQPVATWHDLGGPSDFAAAVALLVPAFADYMNMSLESSTWHAEELAAARQNETRYASATWTRTRRR